MKQQQQQQQHESPNRRISFWWRSGDGYRGNGVRLWVVKVSAAYGLQDNGLSISTEVRGEGVRDEICVRLKNDKHIAFINRFVLLLLSLSLLARRSSDPKNKRYLQCIICLITLLPFERATKFSSLLGLVFCGQYVRVPTYTRPWYM